MRERSSSSVDAIRIVPNIHLAGNSPRVGSSPPSVRSFVPYPASWYLLCESRCLRDKPFSKTMLGRQFVAFRDHDGQVHVLDARCSHLGADLGNGTIEENCLVCPFHGWKYNKDGVCMHIPSCGDIPAFARQQCYPAQERHGFVFFFNGRKALFPLPFFENKDPDSYSAARPFRYVADCTWYMNAAHGFDIQHFDSVHERKLLGTPRIEEISTFARRNSYEAQVIGRSIFDRLLRRFLSTRVNMSITCWGGTFFLVDGRFNNTPSQFMIVTQPLENGETVCDGLVFARRHDQWLVRTFWQPILLWLRRLFTYSYLKDEAKQLRGTTYRPERLLDRDQEMINFFQWVTRLPQHEGNLK